MTPLATQALAANGFARDGYGFDTGETRARLNAALAAEVAGGRLNAAFDFSSYYQDSAAPSKWQVPFYSSTLAAATVAGAAAISLAASPPLYGVPVFEPADAANNEYGSTIYGVSGSDPYAAALTFVDPFNPLIVWGKATKAHAVGTAVRLTISTDGAHPAAAAHIAAADLQAIYRRLAV